MNNLKTVGLLSFMSALVWLIAIQFGGGAGIWIGLVLAVGLNFFVYFFSAKMALRASRAKPVEEHELPAVYAIIRRLAASAEMPMPSIHLIDSPQPNAFATGRNPKHAAVAVTTGIMEIMNNDELEGVLAHELSHVKNRGHPHLVDRGDDGCRSVDLRQDGLLVRWWAREAGTTPGRHHQHRRSHPGAVGRDDHPHRHLPIPGVRGRRLRGSDDRELPSTWRRLWRRSVPLRHGFR